MVLLRHLYEFAENGILGSARVVMDEANDFYCQIKAVGIEKVTIDIGNGITLPAIDTSMEFRAMAEIAVRMRYRHHDFNTSRFSVNYLKLPTTATEYLISNGFMEPFDLESGEDLPFKDIMEKYAKRLSQNKKEVS